MSAPVLDADMRAALAPWDGIWKPKGGLLSVTQHTTQQLLRAGSQRRVQLSNADANFLQVIAHQGTPLGRMQSAYLGQLVDQYNREAL